MKKVRIVVLFFVLFALGTIALNAQNTHVKQMTKKDFIEKVYNYEKDTAGWKFLGDKPIIIDFYANWCRPCKILSPILEELANEYQGKIEVYKIDVDKEKTLAKDFGIASIPTMLFIPADQDPKIQTGLLSKEDLKEIIESFLLK